MSAATMNEMDRLVHANREQADRIAELEQWQRDMVAKAAEQSLGGYREMGQRAAKAESERDEAFAKGKQVFEDLRRVEADRDALAAHVERLREGLHQALIHWGAHCTDEDGAAYAECDRRCDEATSISLARLKAQWQAEALNRLLSETVSCDGERVVLRVDIDRHRDEYRRQAEGGES